MPGAGSAAIVPTVTARQVATARLLRFANKQQVVALDDVPGVVPIGSVPALDRALGPPVRLPLAVFATPQLSQRRNQLEPPTAERLAEQAMYR